MTRATIVPVEECGVPEREQRALQNRCPVCRAEPGDYCADVGGGQAERCHRERSVRPCQVCAKAIPEENLVNCSRACTVKAADRRRRGKPIDDASYRKVVKVPARVDGLTPGQRKLKRRRDWLRRELERVTVAIRATRTAVPT